MFTGIIEDLGKVKKVTPNQNNLNIWLECSFTDELKVDQSIAHNGVCLTVDAIEDDAYSVTIIQESLSKSNLGSLQKGDFINLERCMPADSRFDGHIVQGHVDTTGICESITDQKGSYDFEFSYDQNVGLTVPKGSITINGISLTVVNSRPGLFSVSIIPYTLEHTNLNAISPRDYVNLEFDIVGKYIQAILEKENNQ